jgi:hypothetical protein
VTHGDVQRELLEEAVLVGVAVAETDAGRAREARPQLLPKRRTAKTLASGGRGQNPLGACQQTKGLQEAG